MTVEKTVMGTLQGRMVYKKSSVSSTAVLQNMQLVVASELYINIRNDNLAATFEAELKDKGCFQP